MMRVDRTRGVQQPSKLKIAEFDSPYPLQRFCPGGGMADTTVLEAVVERRGSSSLP